LSSQSLLDGLEEQIQALIQHPRPNFERILADLRQRRVDELAGAASMIPRAVKLQPLSAHLQYVSAAYFLKQTNFAAAREHFQKACDCDALPFRADSRINDIIRQAAQTSSGTTSFC